VIEDIQATFLHRFTALARTRIANARVAITRRDPVSLGVAARDMHSIAGEGGLLGIADVVPIARRAEVSTKQLASDPTGADEVTATLLELEELVERLARDRV
jgi:HPt (histidine-containing phosphotransfer) domain-containing protein